jgi:hypothetical protein
MLGAAHPTAESEARTEAFQLARIAIEDEHLTECGFHLDLVVFNSLISTSLRNIG